LVAALAVALVFGALPMAWCASSEGSGWVVLGDHRHEGGCHERHACACGDDLCGGPEDGVPEDEECCRDEIAAPLVAPAPAVVLPPAPPVAFVVASLPGDAALAARPDAVEVGDPDPGDPDLADLATVVLLR
jgi:hypothetical protein